MVFLVELTIDIVQSNHDIQGHPLEMNEIAMEMAVGTSFDWNGTFPVSISSISIPID
jgi:hypothetical protein